MDGTARVWDLASGRGTPTLPEHKGPVFSIALTPDGHRMVTGGGDGMARVWDAASLRQVLTPLDHTALDHTSAVISVAVSADGQRIVTGTWDRTAGNWAGGTAKLWDALSGRELLTLKPLNGPTGPVRPVVFTPDGRRIVTGNWDGTTRLWDAASGRELLTFKGHAGPANRVAVTPDGRRLVTGGFDGMVKIWDIVSGRELRTINTHSGWIMSVAVTPDGQRIVTGSDDGTARLWDAVSGRQLLRLQGHAGSVNAVAVTRDGQRIITGHVDGTVRLWDVVSERQLLVLKGHAEVVWCIALSPDGQRLITASGDGTVKIWEAASREQVDLWAKEDQDLERRWAAWQRPGASAPGFIQDWLVLSPLALERVLRYGTALEAEQLAGEANLRPRAGERVAGPGGEYTWQAHHTEEPVLDFNRLAGKGCDHSVAYAVCYVISDAERHDLLLQVGTDDHGKVYLNGQELYKYIGLRQVVTLDPVGPVRLRKGTNVLVLKVVNHTLDWQCCARFVDREGSPAHGLRISLTPED